MKSVRKSGPVLPVYVHEPSLIAQPDVSRQHQCFVQETLEELSADIESIGGSLTQLCGEAVEAFKKLHAVSPITRIWAHQETTQNAQFERDNAVRAWCRDNGVELMEIEQNGIVRGAQEKEPFPDYFARSVATEIRNPMGKDLSARFAKPPIPSVDKADIPVASGEDKPKRQRGGRKAAEALMDKFFQIGSLKAYPRKISSPNTADGVSRLSTYMAYGIVSDRELFHRVDQLVTQAHGKMEEQEFEKFQSNARFYLDRLSWRRDYIQTFEEQPRLETETMLPEFADLRSDEFDQEAFERWKAGRTGFPYVDAAMRSLNATGWLNMRLRATAVSFATMNLWIPTTEVARHLAREFLDYSPGVHHVINQVIAGTTSFERLMLFDPVKQGVDHDPDGKFVRTWVPELADLYGPAAHQPELTANRLSSKAGDMAPYPRAIVDHKATAKIARRRIKDARDGTKTSSDGSSLNQSSLF
jgi:deoxyribodipyrimidine photo-lyase